MASQASDDNNRHPWKQTAWNERRDLKDALKAIPESYSPHKSVAVDDMHAYAQRCLFEYHSVFAPKADEFGGDVDPEDADADEIADSLWWQPITAVQIPVDGRVRLNGHADMLNGDPDNRELLSVVSDRIPSQEVVLRLGNLRQLFQSNNTFRLHVEGWVANQGETTETLTEVRYLPLNAITDVRSQLDKCLDRAGWLPHVANNEDAVITKEDVQNAPNDVKERILPD